MRYNTANTAWSLVIFGLLLLAFCLGLPQFHYTVAIMIALILRHKHKPQREPLFRFGLNPSLEAISKTPEQ